MSPTKQVPNTSFLRNFFSPILQNFVTTKFEQIKSSLGIEKNKNLDSSLKEYHNLVTENDESFKWVTYLESDESQNEESENKESENDEFEEFDSFMFIATLPPLEKSQDKELILPLKLKNSEKITLVLDLDETLVHCSLEKIENPDLIFSISFEGQDIEIFVRKRPGFDQFLERVSQLFEVAVFTASQKDYADKLLSILDPTKKWVQHRLFRDSCIFVSGNYLKDLSILGRELSKVVIIDNSPHVFGYQLDNGVPIESWFDDHTDRELFHLLPFLEKLAKSNDVRPIIRRKFKLHKKVEYSKKMIDEFTNHGKE